MEAWHSPWRDKGVRDTKTEGKHEVLCFCALKCPHFLASTLTFMS